MWSCIDGEIPLTQRTLSLCFKPYWIILPLLFKEYNLQSWEHTLYYTMCIMENSFKYDFAFYLISSVLNSEFEKSSSNGCQVFVIKIWKIKKAILWNVLFKVMMCLKCMLLGNVHSTISNYDGCSVIFSKIIISNTYLRCTGQCNVKLLMTCANIFHNP